MSAFKSNCMHIHLKEKGATTLLRMYIKAALDTCLSGTIKSLIALYRIACSNLASGDSLFCWKLVNSYPSSSEVVFDNIKNLDATYFKKLQ